MKPKKTIKSLAELSADSISAEAEPEKTQPKVSEVRAETAPKIPPESFQSVHDVRYPRWGINE